MLKVAKKILAVALVFTIGLSTLQMGAFAQGDLAPQENSTTQASAEATNGPATPQDISLRDEPAPINDLDPQTANTETVLNNQPQQNLLVQNSSTDTFVVKSSPTVGGNYSPIVSTHNMGINSKAYLKLFKNDIEITDCSTADITFAAGGDAAVIIEKASAYIAFTTSIETHRCEVTIAIGTDKWIFESSISSGGGSGGGGGNIPPPPPSEGPPDSDSLYKNAIIKQSYVNSGIVIFDNVSGDLTANDSAKGFTKNATTLSFDTSGKALGMYDITLNNISYSVAIVNSPSNINIPQRPVVMATGTEPILSNFTAPDGIYYSNGINNNAFARQVTFANNQANEIMPIYLYHIKDNALVSMEGYAFVLESPNMDVTPFVTTELVTISGIKALKVSLTNNVMLSSFVAPMISILDSAGNFISVVEVVKLPPLGYEYGFTNSPAAVDDNSSRAFGGNSLTTFVGEGLEGNAAPNSDPTKHYLTKKSGNPAKYDYLLYDEIDIATFKVESSNNAFIKVKSILGKTPNGKNAIGYELELVDNAKVQAAEILVSFKDKSGKLHSYYGGITCAKKPAPLTERIVTNVAEFKVAYATMTSGKIIMAEGTYSMDFVHNKNVSVVAQAGAKVIINGENTTNTAAIVTIGVPNSAEISGIIIDGRDNARDGMSAANVNGYASNITIKNCNIGIRPPTRALDAYNTLFKNNKIAIDAGADTINISNCVFQDNEIAIKHTAATPSGNRAYLNKFINNDCDYFVATNYNNIVSTQNYYQGVTQPRKPIIQTQELSTAKVQYSPYYIDSNMTILTADILGSKSQNATRAITKTLSIPVDRSINPASLFDSNLFMEMKQAGNEGMEASIPITEIVDPVNYVKKVTTIWNFNNDEGNLVDKLPATMNLEVKNTPSTQAQAIIDATIANKADIVQYVNFTHNGMLPGFATIKILKTNNMTKENLKLFYINKVTGKVEEAEIVDVKEETIDGEVYYIVTVAHCSEYIISTAIEYKTVVEETPVAPPATTPTTPTPATPTTTNPVIKAPATPPDTTANSLTSAVEIENKFENTNGTQVEVNIEQKPLLSTKSFEILSDNSDKELVLKGDNYSWTFKGSEITNPNAINGTSFDTSISLESPNKDKIQSLTGDADIVNIYFNYHGELPGPAQITANIGKQHAGTTKQLYYYNDKTDALEHLGEFIVDAEGNIVFTITHCSDYLFANKLLTSTTKETKTPVATPNDAPQVAPTTPEKASAKTAPIGIIIFIAVAVVGIGATMLVLKLRKKAV